RISKSERIVQSIAIPVVSLAIEWRLYERIRRQESSKPRVVHAALHIDEPQLAVFLLVGKAPRHSVRRQKRRPSRRRKRHILQIREAVAVGITFRAIDYRTVLIGRGFDRAQSVIMQIRDIF